MTAVILAAGRGSRMGDWTAERPKCLTELAGRSLLDWQLEALMAAGVHDVIVVAGYAADQVAGRFTKVVNDRWASTNMVSSLLCASEYLTSGACIVNYGDIVFHPGHVTTLLRAEPRVGITYDTQWESLWRARFSNPLNDAETFKVEAGCVQTIGNRATTSTEVQGQYMGLLHFTPDGWAQVLALIATLGAQEVDRLQMTGLLQRLVAQQVCVRAIPVEGRWCEVDTADDVRTYHDCLSRARRGGPGWLHDWRTG